MADIIVELDQRDHLEFDLKQEDQKDIDLEQIKAVVIGGIKYEEDPVDSGFVKYNAETDKYTTITPESTVTESSENIVTSKAVYDHVKTHVDTKIADLVNSAPEMLDTLGEVAKAIQENETVIDALNSTIENKQDKLIAGENITINENNVISATGGLNIADLPKFTNKLYINMAKATSLAGVLTLPIVSSSNFVVDWGDGTTTDYVEATTSISHTYSDTNFAGWVYIYGDWKGVLATSSSSGSEYNNKKTIERLILDANSTENGRYWYCSNLKSVYFPNGTYILGASMFRNCEKLEDISLPSGLVEIKSHCFMYCRALKEIKIPDSVTTIGQQPFGYDENLENVILSKNLSSIPSQFLHISNVKVLDLPYNTLKQMSYNASFSGRIGAFTVPYSLLKEYKTATNWSAYANKIYPKGGNYSETITIPSSSWDTSTNTVTVEAVGATTEARNIITWNVSSGGVQVENTYGLKCTAQGTMSLTFSCETIPTEDVEVSVRYMLTNY